MSESTKSYSLGPEQILRFLPHRYPFLMIDRVVEIHPMGNLSDVSAEGKAGTRVIAEKNVTFNEPYFQGHFPGRPIMPGVLQIEAMAQTACFSLYPYFESDLDHYLKDFQTILLGAEDVRFRKPVVPGDVVRCETVVDKSRSKLWTFQCHASVRGEKVAEAKLLAFFTTGHSPSQPKETQA